MNEIKNDIPIIKTFIHENKCYFYDTYSNQLLNVSKEQFIEIGELQKIGLNEYKNLNKDNKPYQDIIMMINKGFLREQFIEKIEHPDTKYIAYLVDRCINQLIIEVTSACNFKCRYCHQTGKSALIPKTMNEDMAYRSVDFLFEHSKDAHEVTITFYGGEPLLNFELIKSTVLYSNRKFKTKPVSYNMTTNGSLINDKFIDFLIDYNFSLLISLDGDESTQNRHRKYSHDGGSTFNVVWNNIMKIRDSHPSYFDSNVSFNSVILQDENPEDVMNFFTSNGISKSAVSIRNADLNGIDYTHTLIPLNEYEKSNESFEDKFKYMLKCFNDKNKILSEWHHNGPCVPVARRLFVNTEGNFFPCEKVESESSCLLGSLDSGIDVEKAIQILNIGRLTNQDCTKCWALRLCSICVLQCIDEGTWSRDKKMITCKTQKEDAMMFLKEYIKNKK